MSALDRVLIAGTGPAAVQLAVLLKRWHGSSVAIVGRRSVRSAPFFEALEHNGNLLSAEAGKPTLTALAGECRLDACYTDYTSVRGDWDTLLLAVTADAYLPVLKQLPSETLASLRCVALLSPTFGSHALVRQYLRVQGSGAETISLSTYLGDTRRVSDEEPTRVLTAAVKRRVYIGSAGEGERRGTGAGASGMSEGHPGASESESGTSDWLGADESEPDGDCVSLRADEGGTLAGSDCSRADDSEVGASSSRSNTSDSVEAFRALYAKAGIELIATESALAAEARNISLYVHPPLFMNEIALNAVFGPTTALYVYKLFPEGPITQTLIREMLTQWQEITQLCRRLGVSALNLLQFMVDDNYPVRPESLARDEIDRFMTLDPLHQQYLLYVRYASLLIDPYSEPDEHGRYFDFSAVPIRRVFLNREGAWDIPRMPKEDYYRLKLIQGIARHAQTPCPMIDTFVARYECYLLQQPDGLEGHPLSSAFEPQTFEDELRRIRSELPLAQRS